MPFLYHQFAEEAVGKTAGYEDGSVASGFGNCGWGGGEVQGFVVAGAADVLGSGIVLAFNHYFTVRADIFLVIDGLYFALFGHEHFQAVSFFFVRDGIL